MAGRCDIVMGAPANIEMAQTSAPYYRSTYVFVNRKDGGLKIASFDDPPLRKLKIGAQIISFVVIPWLSSPGVRLRTDSLREEVYDE